MSPYQKAPIGCQAISRFQFLFFQCTLLCKSVKLNFKHYVIWLFVKRLSQKAIQRHKRSTGKNRAEGNSSKRVCWIVRHKCIFICGFLSLDVCHFQVREVLRSQSSVGMRHRDHAVTGNTLKAMSSGLSSYFFGPKLDQKLTVEKFLNFQRQLQTEILRLEVKLHCTRLPNKFYSIPAFLFLNTSFKMSCIQGCQRLSVYTVNRPIAKRIISIRFNFKGGNAVH